LFENVFKKPQNLSKYPTLMKKNLNATGNNLKKPHSTLKSLSSIEIVFKKPRNL
jgi:hypothetical protein